MPEVFQPPQRELDHARGVLFSAIEQQVRPPDEALVQEMPGAYIVDFEDVEVGDMADLHGVPAMTERDVDVTLFVALASPSVFCGSLTTWR